MRPEIRDYLGYIQKSSEETDFIVIDDPIGGPWNKNNIALKRNVSAFQVVFDKERIITDKEYKKSVYQLLTQVGYVSRSFLSLAVKEPSSPCEPE